MSNPSPPSPIEELAARIGALPEAQAKEFKRKLREAAGAWRPTPGPQMEAYECLADVLLFGGEVGGSKTDLLLGLAFTAHRRSLLMRKRYVDLGSMIDRALQINGTRRGFNGSIPPKLRTTDGRHIDFGGASQPDDWEHWQGQPHDFIGIDEVAHFEEFVARALMGWVRSVDDEQRTRVVFASNAPTGPGGAWMIHMFAPWLDTRYPYPAEPGELRWVVTNSEGRDQWVDGPDAQIPDGEGGFFVPLSRTFIPSSLNDNPFLAGTRYKARVDAMPKQIRAAMKGDFLGALRDDADQLVPTEWIRAAQDRWTEKPPDGVPQCAIGVDGARKHDDSVLAIRHDGWYAPMIAVPGHETPHGTDLAALVLKHRRDGSVPVIDVIESVGAQAYAHLKDNGVEGVPFRGNDPTTARTAEKQLGFYNRRSEVYWRFREALDPLQAGGSPIMLPDDPELVSDLTSLTWELAPRGIKVLSKEKIVEKLGRSPNKGDATVMAWHRGAKVASHYHEWQAGRFGAKPTPGVNMGARRKVAMRRR